MPLWRPPSEGPNLIIQATLGCSFNGCTFCSMYKDKTYAARPLDDVCADIDRAQRAWPDAHRVFLADGDALALETDALLRILDKLAETLPALARVSCYATPLNLNRKSTAELRRLKDAKLNQVYVGIESGSDDILRRIKKGSRKAMITALERADEAALKVSATVILGLGGKTFWQDHIAETASLINRVPPTYLSTLQLGLEERMVDEFNDAFGRDGGTFEPQDDAGVLAELAGLLEQVAPPRPVIFRSNHASNCLPLAGTLPKDSARLLGEVRRAQTGARALRPEGARGF